METSCCWGLPCIKKERVFLRLSSPRNDTQCQYLFFIFSDWSSRHKKYKKEKLVFPKKEGGGGNRTLSLERERKKVLMMIGNFFPSLDWLFPILHIWHKEGSSSSSSSNNKKGLCMCFAHLYPASAPENLITTIDFVTPWRSDPPYSPHITRRNNNIK